MRNVLTITALLIITLGTSCLKDNQAKDDREAIQKYLSDHNLTATEHSSGMFYIIEVPGSGGHPPLSAKVTVRYIAAYLDGVILDQTQGSDTAKFNLGGLIDGWRIAIPLLQKEGKGTFLIPSALAYGGNPPGGVRPNAPLRFEIELVDFE